MIIYRTIFTVFMESGPKINRLIISIFKLKNRRHIILKIIFFQLVQLVFILLFKQNAKVISIITLIIQPVYFLCILCKLILNLFIKCNFIIGFVAKESDLLVFHFLYAMILNKIATVWRTSKLFFLLCYK